MPSLREQAQTIRNETQAGANTAERVGQVLEDSADVIETVDTVEDLRDFDTTILSEGDKIKVRAHNTTGLDEGFGSGIFVWITTPLFSLQESVTTGQVQPTVSPLTRGLSGNGEPDVTNKFFGDNLVFEDGETATVVCNQQSSSTDPDDTVRSFGRGDTRPILNFDSAVPSGKKAFFADDGGVYIRPNTTAGNGSTFDGLGYWERILPKDASVTYTMYGAIPEYTFRNANPHDSTDAIQRAEDSLFDVITTGGHYYVTSTIIHRRPKDVKFVGSGFFNQYNPDAHGRFEAYLESNRRAYLFTDLNIDVYEIRSSGNLDINVNCRLISGHNKSAIRVYGAERIKGEYNCIVHGDITDFLSGADVTSGTRAFNIDLSIDLPRDQTYSNGGSFSFNSIKLAASNCYSGISTTAQAGDNFANSNRYTLLGRRIVRPIYLYGTSPQSDILGWYQEMDNVPNDSTTPVVYIRDPSGCYFNIMSYDAQSGTGRHEVLLEIDASETDRNLGRARLGPKLLTQTMSQFISSQTKKFIDLPSRLASSARYLDIEQFKTLPKRIERTVTSSEILSSNTTPIDLVSGGADAPKIVVSKVFLTDMDGTSVYSTNTSMELQVNFDSGRYSHVASTIDLANLQINNDDYLWQSVSEPTNVNSSSSASSIMRLKTATGDPTGGDASFRIVIEYYDLST